MLWVKNCPRHLYREEYGMKIGVDYYLPWINKQQAVLLMSIVIAGW